MVPSASAGAPISILRCGHFAPPRTVFLHSPANAGAPFLFRALQGWESITFPPASTVMSVQPSAVPHISMSRCGHAREARTVFLHSLASKLRVPLLRRSWLEVWKGPRPREPPHVRGGSSPSAGPYLDSEMWALARTRTVFSGNSPAKARVPVSRAPWQGGKCSLPANPPSCPRPRLPGPHISILRCWHSRPSANSYPHSPAKRVCPILRVWRRVGK